MWGTRARLLGEHGCFGVEQCTLGGRVGCGTACGRDRARDRRCERRRLGGLGEDAAGGGGRDDAEGAGDRSDCGAQGKSAEQRGVAQPGEGPDDHSHPSKRDVQEGTDDVRVELRTGALDDLLAGVGTVARLLVGARRRDDIEHVGNCHDPSGQWYLVAAESARVAVAVPALMVVADRVFPALQPFPERSGQGLAEERVLAQDFPLRIRWPARLGQDLSADVKFADVVQERSPVEQIKLVRAQAELFPDHDRIGADTFRVAARQPVVNIQGRNQLEQPLG